jgi:hypothetical protein
MCQTSPSLLDSTQDKLNPNMIFFSYDELPQFSDPI